MIEIPLKQVVFKNIIIIYLFILFVIFIKK